MTSVFYIYLLFYLLFLKKKNITPTPVDVDVLFSVARPMMLRALIVFRLVLL